MCSEVEIVDDTVIREEKRLENTLQRRLDQSYQASKMLRMNRRSGFSVSLGESVAFFPDKRDRATQSRLGIHCLVIGVSNGSYPAVRVMIPEGIIGDKRSKTSTWFSHDKYNVMHSSSPLGPERRQLRNAILNNTLVYTDYPIISVRDAHRVTYSSHRTVKKKQPPWNKRKFKCNCRRLGIQCSTDNCGCRKAGLCCSNQCLCNEQRCMNRKIHGVSLAGNPPETKAGSDVPKNHPTV